MTTRLADRRRGMRKIRSGISGSAESLPSTSTKAASRRIPSARGARTPGAAEQDPGAPAEPGHRAPHPERPVAIATLGERGGDDGQAGRGDDRRADALE